MSSGTGEPYHDTQIRHLSDDELLRGLAAIERLETAWFLDPARVKDLQRLLPGPDAGALRTRAAG